MSIFSFWHPYTPTTTGSSTMPRMPAILLMCTTPNILVLIIKSVTILMITTQLRTVLQSKHLLVHHYPHMMSYTIFPDYKLPASSINRMLANHGLPFPLHEPFIPAVRDKSLISLC